MTEQTDLTLASLLLDGQGLSVELASSISAADLSRTIDGSPTLELTVEDPHRILLQSGIFAKRITCQVDGNGFELAQISKVDDALKLTFEDLAVAELRQHDSPRKAAAGTTTRVNFVRNILAQETPWIQLYVDPSVHEAIAKVELARGQISSSTTDAVNPNYFSSSSGSSSGGALSASQIAAYASGAGFSGSALTMAVAIALAESGGRPNATHANTNGSTDYGLWQINSVHPEVLQGDWANPAYNAQLAFKISGSGTNFRPWTTYTSGAYKSHLSEAQSASSSPASSSSTSSSSQQLEDSWTCFKRIFAEVNWILYADKGNLYAGPDSAFVDKQTAYRFIEFQNGVDRINFDHDVGKPIAKATIYARASRWVVPPGTVIELPNMGIDQKWLVSKVSRSLFSVVTTIEAKAPEPELPEPDPPASSGSADAGYFGDSASSTIGTTGGGTGPYRWPVGGSHKINSPFGQRGTEFHEGIDIGVPDGTPVCASRDGTVTFAGSQSGYGNVVYIAHRASGTDNVVGPVAATEETRYAHLSVIECRRGLPVQNGQEIGKSGHSGDATGPHLHFEIRKNGKAVDPIPLLASVPTVASQGSL